MSRSLAFRFTLLCIAFTHMNTISAAEVSREVKIEKIHPIASKRPASPFTQNFLRVYVTPAFWGNTDCNQTAFDIPRSDGYYVSGVSFDDG